MVRSIQFRMNVTLAAVLGLGALMTPAVDAGTSPRSQPLSQETHPQDATPSNLSQESPQNSEPAAEPSSPSPKPKAEPAAKSPAAAQERQMATQPAEKKAESATEESRKPAAKSKTVHKKRRHRKTPAASTATPEKTVIRNGGTVDPAVQLAPGLSPEQASSQRQSTSEMLAATDANLKQMSSRQLSSTQQDSISQIRKYMEQAKAAERAGDLQRAHNLASKAALLSDDLVKH